MRIAWPPRWSRTRSCRRCPPRTPRSSRRSPAARRARRRSPGYRPAGTRPGRCARALPRHRWSPATRRR
ncbi:hypothetical protein D5S19_28700 [Amycolatopsis panacis]|uniref:Uncharacterized protein n=1 Tax=Amycolatopsis panacis TaxID=2340917 RepID=A0A419HMY6_9PSEU|nr:hypothetical protein D5S19_28700 [Amycolatopsis panacis]